MGNRNSTHLFPFRHGSYAKLVPENWIDEDSEYRSEGELTYSCLENAMEARNSKGEQPLENGVAYLEMKKDLSAEKKKNRHIAGTVLSLVITGMLSITLGLLVGQNLREGAVISCDTIRCSQSVYDWGETVVIDGTTQSVSSYIAGKMSPQDIRTYLQ